MNRELYEMVNAVLDLCDTLNGYLHEGSKSTLRDICKLELMQYILYLSASDGVIKLSEAKFINDYLGYTNTVSEWVSFIEENNIYSTDFENDVPLGLMIFVKADNDHVNNGITLDGPGMGQLLIATYEALGKELILVDDDIDDQEVEDLNTYIGNLKEYVNEKSIRGDIAVRNKISHTIDEEYIDNNHEEITFLGKQFILPNWEEILEYRYLMDKIARAYNDVNEVLQKRIDKVEKDEQKNGHYGFCIQMEFWDDIMDRGDGVDSLVDAMEFAGMDVCPLGDDYDNYSKRTSGYRSMMRLADLMEEAAKIIYFEKERAVEHGQQVAYRNAASNITGMSYGIITNSAIDLLFYNAVSNATLKSQAKKADEQYAKESGAAAKLAHNAYARQIKDLYYNQFLPAARRCISIWINEVTERALTYETRNDHPTFSEIRNYNQQESKKLTDQISVFTPKSDAILKLQKAFEKCPFNDDIYVKATQIGVIDLDAVRLSHLYNCDVKKDIAIEIEKHCKQDLFNIKYINDNWEILKYCDYGKTRKDILEKLYLLEISKINDSYKELKSLILDNNGLISFIQNRLPSGKNCELFAGSSKEKLKKEVQNYVFSIVKGINIDFLINEELVNKKNIADYAFSDIEAVNEKYFDIISKRVLEYNDKMLIAQKKYQDEKSIYDEKIKGMTSSLENMKIEKESLSVIKFRQKKELEALIDSKQDEIKSFEKGSPKFDWCPA